jgi:hypothetical protein
MPLHTVLKKMPTICIEHSIHREIKCPNTSGEVVQFNAKLDSRTKDDETIKKPSEEQHWAQLVLGRGFYWGARRKPFSVHCDTCFAPIAWDDITEVLKEGEYIEEMMLCPTQIWVERGEDPPSDDVIEEGEDVRIATKELKTNQEIIVESYSTYSRGKSKVSNSSPFSRKKRRKMDL